MSSDNSENALFNVAIATIFAREVLEGCVIIGQYRTVIQKSDHWDEAFKQAALKTVTYAALLATFVAVLVVLAVAIPLGVLSQNLDEHVVEIIEGFSKVIAAICIIQLSLKMPYWLGLYEKVPLLPKKRISLWCNGSYEERTEEKDVGLTLNEIRFNVAWNIWREVAECGVFLIPFFLGTGAKAIPLSALVGIVISLFLGVLLYVANTRMKSKVILAWFMSGLTLFLSTGLFVGGCHEFEEVWGETREVWSIDNPNMSSSQLPMVLLKPFGYSSSRTVLQICCFWLWLAMGCFFHFVKWHKTKNVRKARAEAAEDQAIQDKLNKEVDEENPEYTSRESSSQGDETERASVDNSSSPVKTSTLASADYVSGEVIHPNDVEQEA